MLIDLLQEDLNKALLSKDEVSTSTLRMAISNLKNARIAKGSDLADEEAIGELLKDAKRHKESIAAFEQAGRLELAKKEKAELEVLSKYLPKQMTDEEIRKIVDEAIAEVKPQGPADKGKVMSFVMGKVGRRADGAMVASIVSQKLG